MTTNFIVGNEADLDTAIQSIDIGGSNVGLSAYTINITGTINLTRDLLAINLPSGSTLTIDGGGNAIDGGGNPGGPNPSGGFRVFFVYAGNVTIENLTIQNAIAKGGAGAGPTGSDGFGGGGGAGLGGGLFVAGLNVVNDGTITTGGVVTLDNVTFVDDAAIGGAGGVAAPVSSGGVFGGAGGGLGGAGSIGSTGGGGGGGGIGAVSEVRAGSGRGRGKAPIWRPARNHCGNFCCRFPADAANRVAPNNPGLCLPQTPPDPMPVPGPAALQTGARCPT